MQDGRKHFNTLCGSVPPSPFCPLFSSYLSHLFRPFSVTQGLNLVSTWVQAPHLGTFIWFQYLNFRPWCLSSNFLHFLLSLSFNIYASPVAFLQLLAFILFQYLNFPPVPLNNFLHSFGFICGTPVASPQFLASTLFQYSKALTHLCLSATSCIHAVSISRLPPLVSPQLLACIVIWVQYLCAHMVSILPPGLASPQTSFLHLVSISKIPPRCPSTTSCVHLV